MKFLFNFKKKDRKHQTNLNFTIIIQIEEVEARFRGMPAWKRKLIEKKEAEAK